MSTRRVRKLGVAALGSVVLVAVWAISGATCATSPILPAPNLPAPNHHTLIFTEILTAGYQNTDSCLTCHVRQGQEQLASAHWKWKGTSFRIEGHEAGTHGKVDLINNFCIALPSNEGRCTQCHIGQGWVDRTFDFTNASKLDCLVCHDTTGTYAKAQTTGGMPAEGLDLQEIAKHVGAPGRKNCGACHFYAGGDDNVKHGDLASVLVNATYDMDVHMGSVATGGQDFACQRCHTTRGHKIAGATALHSDEGEASCANCHGSTNVHTRAVLNLHLNRLACQTCHIPAFSRQMATKMEWYWNEAGQDLADIPLQEGRPTYDKKKGRFVWAKNVRPELKWFNGKYRRVIIGVNDQYAQTPVVLADPVGDINDPTAKIHPFKKMIGKQVADPGTQKLLVPHLFGMKGGPNPYWAKFNWKLAVAEGDAYAKLAVGGQNWVDYSGQDPIFVDTVMYLSINHEVAPASQALDCEDCHAGGIDFTTLGYPGDPWYD